MYETSKEVAELLREMADGLEEDRPVAVILARESILIPADANFRVEYDQGVGAGEVVIRATRGLPNLILTHSEKVPDGVRRLLTAAVS